MMMCSWKEINMRESETVSESAYISIHLHLWATIWKISKLFLFHSSVCSFVHFYLFAFKMRILNYLELRMYEIRIPSLWNVSFENELLARTPSPPSIHTFYATYISLGYFLWRNIHTHSEIIYGKIRTKSIFNVCEFSLSSYNVTLSLCVCLAHILSLLRCSYTHNANFIYSKIF